MLFADSNSGFEAVRLPAMVILIAGRNEVGIVVLLGSDGSFLVLRRFAASFGHWENCKGQEAL